MHLELHGGDVGSLRALGSMVSPGLHYGGGLLHPFIDHDETPAWVNKPIDPMDPADRPRVAPSARCEGAFSCSASPWCGQKQRRNRNACYLTPIE
jgi:hypothetical protein